MKPQEYIHVEALSDSKIYANVEHIFLCDMPINVTLITFGRTETQKHQYTYCWIFWQ
jgi:hypothetical protein